VHVPYKGSEAAPQGVAPEETQLTFATPPSALSLAKANKLKIIAVTSANRSPLFPELPTVAEGGASGYEYSFWLGLFGPPVLPSPIVQRLFDASQAVLRDPELVKRILARSNEVVPSKSFSELATWSLEYGVRQAKLALEAGAAAWQREFSSTKDLR